MQLPVQLYNQFRLQLYLSINRQNQKLSEYRYCFHYLLLTYKRYQQIRFHLRELLHLNQLLVMDDQVLKGIVTERDYARKVIVKGRSSSTTRVGEIMTSKVVTATLDQTVTDCMTVMTERKIRHLPVVDDGRVIGMISIGDLVQAIIAHQQEEIEHLEQYISG